VKKLLEFPSPPLRQFIIPASSLSSSLWYWPTERPIIVAFVKNGTDHSSGIMLSRRERERERPKLLICFPLHFLLSRSLVDGESFGSLDLWRIKSSNFLPRYFLPIIMVSFLSWWWTCGQSIRTQTPT
jgi:hypothetical protein